MSSKKNSLYILRLLAGKLEKKLHSVSPDNFLDKTFKGVPLKFFPPKHYNTYHLVHTLSGKFWFQKYNFCQDNFWF